MRDGHAIQGRVAVPIQIVDRAGHVAGKVVGDFDLGTSKLHFPFPTDLPLGEYHIEAEIMVNGETIATTSRTFQWGAGDE